MKKIILLQLMVTPLLLFSSPLFDISKVTFDSISFQTKAKMKIYKKGITIFALPIEIHANTEAIQKSKTGYIRVSNFKIKFTALKTNKMTIDTKTSSFFDKEYRLIKVIEEVNRNGEQQIVTCISSREGLIDNDYKKKLGYKSEVFLLSCDNNSQLKMQTKLVKTKKDGRANLTTKKNFIMTYDKVRYVVEETKKMTIDTSGSIKMVSSKVKAKDLFSIKYREKDIIQLPQSKNR